MEVMITRDQFKKSIVIQSNKTSKKPRKGASITSGINDANNENIILMDGDLEVEMSCIKDGMKVYENYYPNVVVNGCRWNEKSNSGFNINTYGKLYNKLYLQQIVQNESKGCTMLR